MRFVPVDHADFEAPAPSPAVGVPATGRILAATAASGTASPPAGGSSPANTASSSTTPTDAPPAALEIVAGGLQTLVQDGGRWGYARYGVPRSGPMDPFAAAAANWLVGNPLDAAGLEITFAGPTIRFHRDALIAVCGADLSPTLDSAPLPVWTACPVAAGATLKFGRRRDGLRAYLAVAGGIVVPPVLRSRATYLRGALGGLGGCALRPGDRLPVGAVPPVPAVPRHVPAERRPAYDAAPTVRAVLGPHDDRFPPAATAILTSSAYTVAPDSDRMGYRLAGPTLPRREPADLVSGGMPLGGVQVPGDGQPIVLMSDHQMTGGYPLLATVIQADLPLLAQLAPGATVRFQLVDLAAARAAYLAQHAALAEA